MKIYNKGERFGELTFWEELRSKVFPSGQSRRRAVFVCKCGNKFNALIADIKSGHTSSCGCYRNQATIKRMTTHGLSKHPTYKLWSGMKERCYNPNNKSYESYGGRGITISDEWLNNFQSFYDWCMANGYKKGLQIDRIDNDGKYEASNCQFISQTFNARNKSTTKLTLDLANEIRNKKILHPDLSQRDLARMYSINQRTVWSIINNQLWRNI